MTHAQPLYGTIHVRTGSRPACTWAPKGTHQRHTWDAYCLGIWVIAHVSALLEHMACLGSFHDPLTSSLWDHPCAYRL